MAPISRYVVYSCCSSTSNPDLFINSIPSRVTNKFQANRLIPSTGCGALSLLDGWPEMLIHVCFWLKTAPCCR
jgi:hypothetical protein